MFTVVRAISLLLVCGHLGLADPPPPEARRVDTWLVLGPFAPRGGNGHDEDFLSGEAQARPVLGAALAGKTWHWMDDRVYCRNQDDYVDLYTWFMECRAGSPGGGTRNRVAYAGSYVWSARAREVRLRFGANDRAKVWLRGVLILDQTTESQAARDGTDLPVALEAGWNRILVKVANRRQLWGFYFQFSGAGGEALAGLEYSANDPAPGAALEIVTPELPRAYRSQPYVWLEVVNPNGEYPCDHPSASRFRLQGRGGTPPYEWQAGGLPAGLGFDPAEGEFAGKTMQTGEHPLVITLRDGSRPPQTATKELTLRVAPRVTEEWWEKEGRLGGHRHHGGDPQIWTANRIAEQAELFTRLGYTWVSYTIFSAYSPHGPDEIRVIDQAGLDAWRNAMRRAGLRFGLYLSLKDHFDLAEDDHEHSEHKHQAIEALMMKHAPSHWYFDEMHGPFRPASHRNWEFDGLFSLIKTMDPGCLVIMQADRRARDYEAGDLDILEVHGSVDGNAYWDHWPPQSLPGHNPKFFPVDSWKWPRPGWLDAAEWARAIVTMLAEPANLEAPRTFNLDATPETRPGRDSVKLYRELGRWLEPRRHAILACYPYPVREAPWGYAVVNPATGRVYLHLIANARGKTGWHGGALKAGPLGFPLLRASVVPGGQAVPFAQNGGMVELDLDQVDPDPVSTIIELIPGPRIHGRD